MVPNRTPHSALRRSDALPIPHSPFPPWPPPSLWATQVPPLPGSLAPAHKTCVARLPFLAEEKLMSTRESNPLNYRCELFDRGETGAPLCPHCRALSDFLSGEEPGEQQPMVADPHYWSKCDQVECAHWLLLAFTLRREGRPLPPFLLRLARIADRITPADLEQERRRTLH